MSEQISFVVLFVNPAVSKKQIKKSCFCARKWIAYLETETFPLSSIFFKNAEELFTLTSNFFLEIKYFLCYKIQISLGSLNLNMII